MARSKFKHYDDLIKAVTQNHGTLTVKMKVIVQIAGLTSIGSVAARKVQKELEDRGLGTYPYLSTNSTRKVLLYSTQSHEKTFGVLKGLLKQSYTTDEEISEVLPNLNEEDEKNFSLDSGSSENDAELKKAKKMLDKIRGIINE